MCRPEPGEYVGGGGITVRLCVCFFPTDTTLGAISVWAVAVPCKADAQGFREVTKWAERS